MPEKTPYAIWFFPYAQQQTAEGEQDTYVLLRNPCADPKHGSSFLHGLGRGLFPHEVPAKNVFTHQDLTNIAGNIVGYYAGIALPSNPVFLPLHHEPSPLFSGPAAAQEVLVFAVNFGNLTSALPVPAQSAFFPDSLGADPQSLAFCKNYRRFVGWSALSPLMHNLTRTKTDKPFLEFWNPKTTPIHATSFNLQRGADLGPLDPMPVQMSVTYCLEQLAQRIKLAPPKGSGAPRRPLVTREELEAARAQFAAPTGAGTR